MRVPSNTYAITNHNLRLHSQLLERLFGFAARPRDYDYGHGQMNKVTIGSMAGVKRSLGTMLVADHEYEPDATRIRVANPRVDDVDAPTRTPSPSFPPLNGEIPIFNSDASIVLVGIRGSGKSTLAVMAASAMNRKLIDLETTFQRANGLSSAGYKQLHGSVRCHRQQAKTLQAVLDRNRTDCIVVCSWMESRVQALLREFAAFNPVIHVVRDVDAIQEHLKVRDRDKMLSLHNVCRAIFRTCTNFEFFNVSEKPLRLSQSSTSDFNPKRLPSPHLTLKQVERHILKFLSIIYPPDSIPFNEPAFPLASTPPEKLQYTYSLSIPLRDILEPGFDIEEHAAGSDGVEIVVPDLNTAPNRPDPDWFLELSSDLTRAVGVTRRRTVLPLSVHIVLPELISDSSLRVYLDLVTHAARLAPEMLTIDLRLDTSDIQYLVAMKGRAKVVGHYSSVSEPEPWESPLWRTLYDKASGLRCDIVRLVKLATSFEDNASVGRFRHSLDSSENHRPPLVAYNLGTMGRSSAFFNTILTPVSPITKSSGYSTSYQPCITARQAISALGSCFVYDAMKLYVIGIKVDYSLSPAMHNAALEVCGLPHHYDDESTSSLSSVRHLIEDPFFGGASISSPFKVEVITLTHSLSHHGQAIGAVNTLIPIRQLSEDGSLPKGADLFKSIGKAGPVKALYGENTDWVGIRACIRRGLSPANAVRSNTCALVVGAGGMARAAVYAILQVGVQNIAIYNRTYEHAQNMANHFTQLLQKPGFQTLGAGRETKFKVLRFSNEDWPDSFSLPTIIISCIPTHRVGDSPIPDYTVHEPWLGSRTGGVIIELGYNDLKTPLLCQARREAHRGWIAMDGLDLLPDQGFAQFELFTGRRAPRKIMRLKLLQAYIKHAKSADDVQDRIMGETAEDS